MGVLPNILQGVAIGAPIAGGMAQADAIKQQAGAQAAAARHNAALAREQGAAEATRIRRAGRRELARQRLRVGASGVRLEGSPLELLAQNAFEIEREAVAAEIAGRNTARLDEMQARSAKRAGRTGAATALLSGGLQAASTAARLRGPGGF
jgi:hypothetical protein